MIYTVENTVLAGKTARVFVNGNEVFFVIRADTAKGVVIYMPQPARVKKNSDYIYTRKLRGLVTVELSSAAKIQDNRYPERLEK
ncbi:MAG: hypothetical protein M0Q29_09840 [Thiopseudomonas sp.]|nr:hypothetical protein [Thiopseudomonas sp.]